MPEDRPGPHCQVRLRRPRRPGRRNPIPPKTHSGADLPLGGLIYEAVRDYHISIRGHSDKN